VTSAAATRLALLDVDGTLTGCTSIWQYLLEDRGHWHGAGEDNLAAFMAGRISYEEFCELDAQLLAGESYAGLSRTAAGVPFRQGVEALFCHLTASGYRIALISTGLRLLTNHVEERFPVDLCVANDLAVDGDRCTGTAIIEIGDNEKGEHAQRAIRSFGADYVVAIGDSAGDLPMFDVADLSIAVGLTSPAVAAAADFHIGDSDLSAVCGLL
jgi:phosphoserine phosphatase